MSKYFILFIALTILKLGLYFYFFNSVYLTISNIKQKSCILFIIWSLLFPCRVLVIKNYIFILAFQIIFMYQTPIYLFSSTVTFLNKIHFLNYRQVIPRCAEIVCNTKKLKIAWSYETKYMRMKACILEENVPINRNKNFY